MFLAQPLLMDPARLFGNIRALARATVTGRCQRKPEANEPLAKAGFDRWRAK